MQDTSSKKKGSQLTVFVAFLRLPPKMTKRYFLFLNLYIHIYIYIYTVLAIKLIKIDNCTLIAMVTMMCDDVTSAGTFFLPVSHHQLYDATSRLVIYKVENKP